MAHRHLLATGCRSCDVTRHLIPQGIELSSPRERAFQVSLIQRLLNDDPQFVQVAYQSIDQSAQRGDFGSTQP